MTCIKLASIGPEDIEKRKVGRRTAVISLKATDCNYQSLLGTGNLLGMRDDEKFPCVEHFARAGGVEQERKCSVA